ncbi:AmmeMemoRadiSam system radical SAM enzyme [Selenomonas ruminantium]|uniref:AmmeMemoRadiSam system radical SAM enzyme n=1 Tax=Selenomonas ruminantium TaxID=971 RepID=UPI0026F1FD39|nr:AmmeMemoRadiSam system radical SAM enzyme [Selenomonas ruminantium]
MNKQACNLCPHHCALAEGQVGFCHTRRNEGGQIKSLNYGKVTSLAIDPIEKKPLYHFYPGSVILSLGSFGCNMACPFCQNHTISQGGEREVRWHISPEQLAELAQETSQQYGSIGVAFTYNEPLLSYEYLRDTLPLLHQAGQKNVLVTNGQIEEEPLTELLPYVDAMNIDLKTFAEKTYAKLGGSLQAAQRTIQMAAEAGVHVEVTTLVVPGISDAINEFCAEVDWLAAVSREIPLHLSRYFPRYQCKAPATPLDKLYELQRIAQKCMKYVYLGNVG